MSSCQHKGGKRSRKQSSRKSIRRSSKRSSRRSSKKSIRRSSKRGTRRSTRKKRRSKRKMKGGAHNLNELPNPSLIIFNLDDKDCNYLYGYKYTKNDGKLKYSVDISLSESPGQTQSPWESPNDIGWEDCGNIRNNIVTIEKYLEWRKSGSRDGGVRWEGNLIPGGLYEIISIKNISGREYKDAFQINIKKK